ncbi:MAG: serine hydroxymethyltransferase, partial [Mesorhizobium sp.]
MTALARRPWVPAQCEDFVQRLATETSGQGSDVVLAAIEAGIALNRRVHEADCVNLNPATNVM